MRRATDAVLRRCSCTGSAADVPTGTLSWRPSATSVAAARCDLPGYGDSAGLPGSLPEIAAEVARWIDGLDVGPVDVVGLSFGGMVAQHLTLDHPDLVRRWRFSTRVLPSGWTG